jgi:hypothetical protein
MIPNKSLLALLLFSIVGSVVLTTIPLHLLYSSSAQETSDEDQQGEPTGDEEPADESEPATTPLDDGLTEKEKEKEKVPICPVKYSWNANLKKCVYVGGGHWGTSITNETSPSTDVIGGQEQLTLDIINANGLEEVDEPIGDVGAVGDDGTTEKEIKCVKNSQGQTFCYEELKPDEVCLKPIDEKDPPLCPPPG